MDLTPNPEWEAAPLEMKLVMVGDGIYPFTGDGLRFREQDRDAAIKALKEHDQDTLNRLAVPRHIEL